MTSRATRDYRCEVCKRPILKGQRFRRTAAGGKVIRLCNFGCVYVPVSGKNYRRHK
jgi:hypothetical protein